MRSMIAIFSFLIVALFYILFFVIDHNAINSAIRNVRVSSKVESVELIYPVKIIPGSIGLTNVIDKTDVEFGISDGFYMMRTYIQNMYSICCTRRKYKSSYVVIDVIGKDGQRKSYRWSVRRKAFFDEHGSIYPFGGPLVN